MHPDLVITLLIPLLAALEEENERLHAELDATRERPGFAERLHGPPAPSRG